MKRVAFNKNLLKQCLAKLKSTDHNDIYEGVFSAAYLIEQSFKIELSRLSPILCFEFNTLSDERAMRIVLNRLSNTDRTSLAMIGGRKCIARMCLYDSGLQAQKTVLDELFKMRNQIVHSIDDFSFDANSAAETAVAALRLCGKYVIKHLGDVATKLNPLTSKGFQLLHGELHAKRVATLRAQLKEHRAKYEGLTAHEIAEKVGGIRVATDDCTWVEAGYTCPACGQASLDKVGSVDFDWNPDGILPGAGYSYMCRVCELDLSEHEYELAKDIKLT